MATQSSFYDMFVDILRDTFDAENQIVAALPKFAQAASHADLKEAINQHLEETKGQVQRLKKMFKMINENPTGKTCPAMQGILQEISDVINKDLSPTIKDAWLIICCQKMEHYEMATYGSLRAVARHLNNAGISDRIDFDEIADLLQQTLDEESAADEKLTDIAEGGFFSQGINDEAEQQEALAAKAAAAKRKPTDTQGPKA